MTNQHIAELDRRPTLLLVDDLPSNLDLLRSILADQDWRISVALSGRQAIDLIPRLQPDLILLDVIMPEMDGFETCREIKRTEAGKDIPVIFLTAKSGDVELGFEAGGIDYLTKPLRRTEFLARLQTHLRLALLVKDMRARLLDRESLAQLGEMVADVAHEVGTPLGTCVTAASFLSGATRSIDASLSANTLRESDLKIFLEKAREACELLESNIGSATELMRELKINAVDLSSSRQRDLNLRTHVDMVVRSLGHKLKHRNIQINNCVPEDIEVQMQAGLLAKILRNLIVNSLTHAFAAEAAGEINIEARINDRDRLVLAYRDNGCGIDTKLQKEVMQRFFTTRANDGGSGLGLHIIATACEQLGGAFQLESDLGQGVQFTIDLPLGPAHAQPPTDQQAS